MPEGDLELTIQHLREILDRASVLVEGCRSGRTADQSGDLQLAASMANDVAECLGAVHEKIGADYHVTKKPPWANEGKCLTDYETIVGRKLPEHPPRDTYPGTADYPGPSV